MSSDSLDAFRTMRTAVMEEYDANVSQLAALKAEGKVKTATYQQLFARKMTLSAMLDLYKRYGLL